MSTVEPTEAMSHRPSRTGVIAIYLLLAAQVARTLTAHQMEDPAWYAGLFLLFLLLFTAVLWRPRLPPLLLHFYLFIQCAITLVLLVRNPDIDSITTLFAILAFQVPLLFSGRPRWIWIVLLVALTGGSLMVLLGPLRGLALALVTMAACIALPAFVVANEQTERVRLRSQEILGELQATHRRLQKYAEQADELATMEERTRLARELHDSVSQTVFAVTLNSRSAQMLLRHDPTRLRAQLEQLQEQTQSALAQMRSLITELRPKSKGETHND